MELFLKGQGMISIYEIHEGIKVVMARELHKGLEVKTAFKDWINRRLSECDLIEGEDFSSVLSESSGGRPSKDYLLKLDAAKEVAMMERNEKGKKYRRYFIEVEKKYNQQVLNTRNLSPQLQLLIKIETEQKRIEEHVNSVKKETMEVKSELQEMKDTIIINPKADWRKKTNQLIGKICTTMNDYKTPKEKIYSALEERGRCNLNLRLNNLKVRALSNGTATSKVKKLNILDVIANDARLKEIYIAIVKEFAIKYKV